eukprot:6737461-Pyramimonas_sp.AAC.1
MKETEVAQRERAGAEAEVVKEAEVNGEEEREQVGGGVRENNHPAAPESPKTTQGTPTHK